MKCSVVPICDTNVSCILFQNIHYIDGQNVRQMTQIIGGEHSFFLILW